ncbi:MAG: MBL fold metallo-hydrolase [Oceanospirillaceae bacterium]|nr:MBL fold metallo-hydrolase [Oceanospirillaceae bacterium]
MTKLKKVGLLAVTVVLVGFVVSSCSNNETFSNTNPKVVPKDLSDVFKWRMSAEAPPAREAITLSENWRSLTPNSSHYAVWIGHATYLINTGDVTVLTDPIFSNRASPVSWAGPQRLIPPSMTLAQLPPIDAVVVSHNHYDHLDLPSLIALQKANPAMVFLMPQGDKALLESKGLNNVSEFRWWQTHQVNATTFTYTPVQHWSGRGVTGRNTSLWGGWFLAGPDLSIYHAGDTGYSKDFLTTKARMGEPDVAFIPIGAYKPRWFMKNQHVDPAEAVQIALDLETKQAFGMHWGTFVLTDENIKEPKAMLAEELVKRNLDASFFRAPKPGEVLRLKP